MLFGFLKCASICICSVTHAYDCSCINIMFRYKFVRIGLEYVSYFIILDAFVARKKTVYLMVVEKGLFAELYANFLCEVQF